MSPRRVVGDVTDTARWVGHFRALESERPDALFHDPFARELAGNRGRTIAESLPRGPLAWSLAVRTRIFDEMILESIREHGVGTVLNLAAGLDTRPYRLPLPASLEWIEVDHPEILAWKTCVLENERPACRLERVALDLAHRDERGELLARVGVRASQRSTRTLVITEGVLVYLGESEVASLADDLHREFPGELWLLENLSPRVLARQRRMWSKTLRPANAEHRFAPAQGLGFYRAHGWVPIETRSLLDEAQRLGREMGMVRWIRRIESLVPSLKGVYARRQAQFRNAFVCALLQSESSG